MPCRTEGHDTTRKPIRTSRGPVGHNWRLWAAKIFSDPKIDTLKSVQVVSFAVGLGGAGGVCNKDVVGA